MVNAQEWLNEKYSNKSTVEEISLTAWIEREKIDKGELVIADYPNLKRINIGGCKKIDLNKLVVIGCPKVTYLNCSSNELVSLHINDLVNLTMLVCLFLF